MTISDMDISESTFSDMVEKIIFGIPETTFSIMSQETPSDNADVDHTNGFGRENGVPDSSRSTKDGILNIVMRCILTVFYFNI
jgi:hypothetical protein